MTEGNKLEKETGKKPNWKHAWKPLFFFFNTEEAVNNWGDPTSSNPDMWARFSSISKYAVNFLITAATVAGTLTYLGKSLEREPPVPWKWDEARQHQVEQNYQKHRDEAMKTLDKYDLNDDNKLGPEEFNRIYQQMENPKYQEWKSIQDSYKSGGE